MMGLRGDQTEQNVGWVLSTSLRKISYVLALAWWLEEDESSWDEKDKSTPSQFVMCRMLT